MYYYKKYMVINLNVTYKKDVIPFWNRRYHIFFCGFNQMLSILRKILGNFVEIHNF